MYISLKQTILTVAINKKGLLIYLMIGSLMPEYSMFRMAIMSHDLCGISLLPAPSAPREEPLKVSFLILRDSTTGFVQIFFLFSFGFISALSVQLNYSNYF
jgi:hypothetical protein